MCARLGENNHGVKVNDLGSNPDCDNCHKPPRIKQPQSMVVNVKLVALDNLQAASIPQSSELMKIRGERMCAVLAAYSDARVELHMIWAKYGSCLLCSSHCTCSSLTLLLLTTVHLIVQMFPIPLSWSGTQSFTTT